MNTGVIFIMDKISKLMGDNIIHAIKMVLLVGAGAAVYIMTYYGINSWVIMELMIIIAILIVQYIEQITIKGYAGNITDKLYRNSHIIC